MTNQDWTEQLRQRMDDYETPVPEGLWDDVERRVARRARTAVLRRWLTAAAAVALIIVGGWMLWTDSHEQPLAAHDGRTQSVVAQLTHAAAAPSSADGAAQRDAESVRRVGNHPRDLVTAHNELPATPSDATTNIQDSPGRSETQNPSVDQDAQQVRESSGARDVQQVRESSGAQDNLVVPAQPRQKELRRSRDGSRYTIALTTSNLLANNTLTTVEPVRMSPAYMGSLSSAMARTSPVFLANSQEEASHHAPLSFGLTVSRTLTLRWWAECGLSYSYVASTFTHRYPTHVTADDQRLHYVGVPIALGYTCWQSDRLRTYAAAGAEAMVNVSATVSQGTIGRDRLQMAFGLSAGISCELLAATSIYCQPSLRYYPDNGSPMQNIFKDRPLQFDLRFGLRYTFGRK